MVLSSGWQLQDASKVPDSGEVISQPAYLPSQWYQATVPGTVLTSLVNDGVYPEPLYGENNRPDKIPENLCRTSYWYRTQLDVPGDYRGKRVWLNFDGINYTAQVWANGRKVGKIEGAFAGEFSTLPIWCSRANRRRSPVRINPPPHPGNPHEHTVAAGTGGNGGILMEDGPSFGCTIGWDWIPPIRDRDMGIWQKVSLSATGPVCAGRPGGQFRSAFAQDRHGRPDGAGDGAATRPARRKRERSRGRSKGAASRCRWPCGRTKCRK